MRSRFSVWRGLPAILTVTGACEMTSPASSLDRQLGRATADYVVGEFAWTPDSRSIAYVSNGADSRAYLVGVADHSSRAITDAVTGEIGSYRAAQIGSDPDAFYFSVMNTVCSSASIYQHFATGHLDTIATRASNALFVASPSGNRVAFTAVAYSAGQELCPEALDSLVVLDVEGATRGQRRTIELGIGWPGAYPLALSDDGSLIYLGTEGGESQSRTVVRFAAFGVAPRDVWWPATIWEAVALDVSWIGGRPHLTIARSDSADRTATLTDLDVVTGQQTVLATLTDVSRVAAFTRSFDGRAWAAWVYKSEKPMCVLERECVDARLLVSAPGAPQPVERAAVYGDDYPGRMKFSPNTEWLAFGYASGLYVRATR